jgi:hypothetical protein
MLTKKSCPKINFSASRLLYYQEKIMSKSKLPPEFKDLEKTQAAFVQQIKLAGKISEKNPELGMIASVIMAGDICGAKRWEKRLIAGDYTFDKIIWLIGSYARFDFALRQMDKGRATPEQIYKILPGLWSFSDPDDLNPRFLKIWQAAYEWNGKKYLRDGKALPRDKQLVVYRGQDRTQEKVGIAWSLDQSIAAKFARGAWARQRDRDGVVLYGLVDRKNILGYMTKRGEAEVIIDPKHVEVGARVKP